MTQPSSTSKRVGGDTIRLNGKIYTIEKLIKKVGEVSVSSTRNHKFFALVLFVLLYSSMECMDFSGAGWGALFFAVLIHELGHFLGMMLVGRKDAAFQFSFFVIPDAFGDGGTSASRKAVVALGGPAMSLMVGLSMWSLANDASGGIFVKQLTYSLLFIGTLNLVPILPFDGGEVIEHLLLIRFPKFELGYLIISGITLFIFFYGYYCAQDRVLMILISYAVTAAQFHNVKKVDNMSSMIYLLRKNGHDKQEQYSPKSVKQMEFSLACFDVQDELSVASILREAWDRAREVPATYYEVIFVMAIYIILVVTGVTNGGVVEMFGLLK
ncbi:hypothetical protein P4B35_00735 [Pontiellaceae bacterium B12227]|nr:hypothetical protein [Pontiellaceae bacterium B12227]